MNGLVTIGIPIYKRLQYLPNVLKAVQAQDYPRVELIVSDNGLNGPELRELVQAHYSRPYRMRRNPAIVNVAQHFNQIINEASGEYTIVLADDDEISPNYLSDLVPRLEGIAGASVALARQEMLDANGTVLRRSKEELPDSLSGEDFILATWGRNEFRYECFATFLARTKDLKACGGYADFTRGTNNDNALLVKLALGRRIAFSSNAVFRWRIDDSSLGWSVSIQDLAAGCREFMEFLDSDPMIRRYAQEHGQKWRELRACLVEMTWQTYFWRWKQIYRKRLKPGEWARAAFAMPFARGYYRQVLSEFIHLSKSSVRAGLKGIRSN